MMNKKGLISIITVCYNAEDSIENTINSVINQNNDNIEYIIIDGGSKDNTMNIIKKNKIAYEFKCFSEKDDGIYDAMNKGLNIATGDYIFFLNSGDKFIDNRVISDVINEIKNNNPDVLYGDILSETDNGVGKVTYNRFKVNKKSFCRGNMICHQSIFIKNQILKEYKFNIKYKICADKDLIINLYKHKFKFKYFERTISIYDRNGISSTNITQLKKETNAILFKHYPLYFSLIYAFKLFKNFIFHKKQY